MESFSEFRLIVSIPFVCKILETSVDSKIFHYKNPWIYSLLQLVVELYLFADLKLNLKFEVEVLFKKLELDIEVIVPANVFRALRFSTRNSRNDSPPSSDDYASSELDRKLIFRVEISPERLSRIFRTITCLAFEFAIREVLGSIIERSIMIAGITTKELIFKDFKEMNTEASHFAALHMVKNLTGKLALVTAKEPIRQAVTSNLKSFLQLANMTVFLILSIEHLRTKHI